MRRTQTQTKAGRPRPRLRRWCVAMVVAQGAFVLAGVAPAPAGTYPLVLPMQGQVISDFGDCRDGCSRFHEGYDIDGSDNNAAGDEVYASFSGVVTRADDIGSCTDGNRSGYGNVIYVDHGNGYVTRYAHLLEDSLRVVEGQQVFKGQLIAQEGRTGNACEGVHHLHWEIRFNGDAVDLSGNGTGQGCSSTALLCYGQHVTAGRGRWQQIRTSFGVPGTAWKGYSTLGGTLTSAPDAATWASGRADVFLAGTDGGVYHKALNEGTTTYSGWDQWGVPPGSTGVRDVSVTSWGRGRLDVFARGWDLKLYWRAWQGSKAPGWTDVSQGKTFVHGPDAASWGPNRLDLFAVDAQGRLQATYSQNAGGTWNGWRDLGHPPSGPLTGAPAAVSWGPGRIDVVARGTDGRAWHMYFEGSWSSTWRDLGGGLQVDSGPDLGSWGVSRLELVVRGTDNAVFHKYWGGVGWSGWTRIPGLTVTSDPAVASWAPDHLEVFGRSNANLDQALWTNRLCC